MFWSLQVQVRGINCHYAQNRGIKREYATIRGGVVKTLKIKETPSNPCHIWIWSPALLPYKPLANGNISRDTKLLEVEILQQGVWKSISNIVKRPTLILPDAGENIFEFWNFIFVGNLFQMRLPVNSADLVLVPLELLDGLSVIGWHLDLPFFGPVRPDIEFLSINLICSPCIYNSLNKWLPSIIFPSSQIGEDLDTCSAEVIAGLWCHDNIAGAHYTQFKYETHCPSLVHVIVDNGNCIPPSTLHYTPIRLAGVGCKCWDRNLEFDISNREVLDLGGC